MAGHEILRLVEAAGPMVVGATVAIGGVRSQIKAAERREDQQAIRRLYDDGARILMAARAAVRSACATASTHHDFSGGGIPPLVAGLVDYEIEIEQFLARLGILLYEGHPIAVPVRSAAHAVDTARAVLLAPGGVQAEKVGHARAEEAVLHRALVEYLDIARSGVGITHHGRATFPARRTRRVTGKPADAPTQR
jgi:hypothetical protein